MTGLGLGQLARAAALAGCLPAAAASAADMEMGHDIAREYCIACHDVGPTGKFKQEPPSFAAIAVYRSDEQIRERILNPSHNSMPDYKRYMIGGNIDDMVAYIRSLEK